MEGSIGQYVKDTIHHGAKKHMYGSYTRFATISGSLVNIPTEKWLGVTRIRIFQAAAEDSKCAYEPVSDLCSDVDPDSDSSGEGSSDKGFKNQGNLEEQKQEELVRVTCRNPRRLRWGDQR